MPIRKYKTDEQRKKAQLKADYAYKRRAQKAFTIRFHKENDKEVIHKLRTVPNRVDYIRQLILKDLGII